MGPVNTPSFGTTLVTTHPNADFAASGVALLNP
jgi:hypothetical protein